MSFPYTSLVSGNYFLDNEDNPSGDSSHLPRRLLTSGAEKIRKKSSPPNKKARHEVEREEPTVENDDDPVLAFLYDVNNWKKDKPGDVGSGIPVYTQTQLSEDDEALLQQCKTSYDY